MSKCYYCKEEMKDENLAKHCKLKHNAAKRVLGEESVSGYFATSAKKPRENENTSSAGSSQGEMLLLSAGRKTPEDSLLTRPETPPPVEHFIDEKDTTEENEHLKDLVKTVKNIDMNSQTSLKEILLLRESVEALENKLKKKIPEYAKPDDVIPEDTRINELNGCATMDDVLETFEELVYEEQTNIVLCELCYVEKEGEGEGARKPGQFYLGDHDEDMENEDLEKKQRKTFQNFKKSIKRHFETGLHVENWKEWHEKNNLKNSLRKRNHDVGMRIARICYSEYREGNSKRHFEQEVLKADLNGCDMGELNHSDQFPRKFRPFVRKEINEKTKKFFNSRLEQTGFEPALNISADKGTNVHRSRQFTTVKACIPDSPNLINSIFLGQPVVKEHDGRGVTDAIKEITEKFGIKSTQLEGASFDGAYFHQSVPNHMKNTNKLTQHFIATHDPLHKTGIADAHIRKDKNFSWLTNVQEICSEIYNKFNWGENHELLLDTCKELEMTLASLTKFSKTRFANSIRNVTINIRQDFQIIVQCLEKIIKDHQNSGIAKEREKSDDASRILKKIRNKKFTLELSGISDIYNIFGKVVNTCQIVDILPHERFDQVIQAVTELKDMVKHKEHSECVESYKRSEGFVGEFPESGKVNGQCRWPSYHADLSDIKTHGKFRSVSINKSFEDKGIETRLARKEGNLNVFKDAIKIVETELVALATRLYNDLSSDIFEAETRNTIELTRNLCDIQSFAKEITEHGSILFATLSEDRFCESAKQISKTIQMIPDNIVKQNYRQFVAKLEDHIKSNEKSELDSKSLIRDFINSDKKLYRGVELSIHIICSAAIKVSVESDVESLVSRYERHFKVDRQLDENRAEEEMEISENGPLLIHADKLLLAAMNKYWKSNGNGEWHFVKKGRDNMFKQSQVLNKLKNQKSKLAFMDK